jgi:CRISPR/Cas system-associated endonuclease Cas3-HD
MPDLIIPEDLEQIIADIIAHEALEKEEKEQEGELDRVYIEDILPEIDENKEKTSSWRIEIEF